MVPQHDLTKKGTEKKKHLILNMMKALGDLGGVSEASRLESGQRVGRWRGIPGSVTARPNPVQDEEFRMCGEGEVMATGSVMQF